MFTTVTSQNTVWAEYSFHSYKDILSHKESWIEIFIPPKLHSNAPQCLPDIHHDPCPHTYRRLPPLSVHKYSYALHINPIYTPAKAAICNNRTQAVRKAQSTNPFRTHQCDPGWSQIPATHSKATYTWQVRWWKMRLHSQEDNNPVS